MASAVSEEETYGINAKVFIEGICAYITGGADPDVKTEDLSLDILCRELQRLFREEARSAGNGEKLDYAAAYALFDLDGDGNTTVSEFRQMLVRLQLFDLVPEAQVPKLLALFDKNKKGYFNYDDFMAFVEAHKNFGDEDDTLDDEQENDDPSNLTSRPPIAITRNSDCDWLAWYLWRQCCSLDANDPEAVVTELEAACTESELTQHKGSKYFF